MKENLNLIRSLVFGVIFAPHLALASEDAERCSQETFTACLNGVSSSVTNGASLRRSGADLEAIERRRKSNRTSTVASREVGAFYAAGDTLGGATGLWLGYSYNDFDSDFAFNGTSLAYEADAHQVLGGIDRLFAERFLLGLSLGYSTTEADTVFNGGRQENDGVTVAPYAAILLTDIFSIDATGGYTSLDYDQHRISPTDGSTTTATFDSDRWFAGANLNAALTRGAWLFGAKVGVLYTDESQDGYTESGSAASAAARTLRTVRTRDIDLTQVTLGGDVAYAVGTFEPYVGVAYVNDLDRDDGTAAGGLPGAFTVVQPDDDDEVQINIGLRYFASDDLTGTVEYSRVEGREDFDSDTVMVNLRLAL